jgi:hypothetical protein
MKFDKPVALNRHTHRQLRIRPGGFNFAAGLHSAPLCASEFFAAAKEYAIVFVQTGNQEYFPVVVLGLRPDENLFTSGDGQQWHARYLPFAVRSYPFASVLTSDQGTLQIVIDEAYAGFGHQEGTALFDAEGEPAPELVGTLKVLQAQHQDIQRTRRLGAELKRLELLSERSAHVKADDGAEFSLNGFWIVDEAKLNALSDAELLPLARRGDLSLITAHLLSIGNLGLLLPKIKPAVAAAAASAAPRRSPKDSKAKAHARE